jgi:hypothetical protein
VSYLQGLGFEVTVVHVDSMSVFRTEHSIPQAMWSCHTVVLEDSGYLVEGHMPVVAIDLLLEDRPDIDGIALPGMPAGSPGMPGSVEGPLEVFAIKDGTSRLHATLDTLPAAE